MNKKTCYFQANRLYDHGDMNTQYGRYETTQSTGEKEKKENE